MSGTRRSSMPLTLYPNRLRLAGYALLYLAVGAGTVAFSVALFSALRPPYGVSSIVTAVIGAVILLGGVVVAALVPPTVYRLLARKPSLTVTRDGIRDGCSLVAGGLGLLRWDEIATILPSVLRKGVAFIIIVPRDVERTLARQGPLARILRRALNITAPGAVSLPEWLLGAPVPDVYARITADYGESLRAWNIDYL